MTLEDMGYSPEYEKYRQDNGLASFGVGRVISEHKERYVVKTTEHEYEAEIIGHMLFSAQNRSDFPATGDWVAISEYDDKKAMIHAIFPRRTMLSRQAVGKQGEKQIIAANVDYAFIVQAVDRDFNINRIERYLTICYEAKIQPLIILNKIDLIDENTLSELMTMIQSRVVQVPVFPISNATEKGIEKLRESVVKGQTYCMLGSSGVGKSTLMNNLAEKQTMKTDSISNSTHKGRHVTSHRELVILNNGGILIDNPGMREVGIADAAGGLELTFDPIVELSAQCKFSDCSHTVETGCAVLEAVKRGEIDQSSYKNFLKMEREKVHFESTVAEKRKKDKDFGKMIKNFKKNRNRNKY